MKENKIPVSQEIKKHLLTGISWMIPLIVAAGICIEPPRVSWRVFYL